MGIIKHFKLLLLAATILASSASLISQERSEEFGIPDRMPLFDGASNDAESQEKLLLYFRERGDGENVSADGTVFVRFVVDSTGMATEPRVLRNANSELDQFAIKYVNEMPKWEPGIRDHKKVKVQFTVPIKFKKEP